MNKLGWFGTKGVVLFAAIVLCLVAGSGNVAAKEGFYLGGGFAHQSVSGDFDGNSAFIGDPVVGPIVLNAKLESGSGLNFTIGYGFTENIGIEYAYFYTTHDGTHTAVPGETLTASVASGIIGVRLTIPTEKVDLFLRLGPAAGIVFFDNNTAVASSPTLVESEYSGGGFGYGAGVEFQINEKVGLEAAYNKMSIDFDELNAGGIRGSISGFSADLTVVNVSMLFHFK